VKIRFFLCPNVFDLFYLLCPKKSFRNDEKGRLIIMKKNRHKIDEPSLSKTLPESDSFYGNLIVEIGRLFINVPYKAGTLENLGKEKLMSMYRALIAPLLSKQFLLSPDIPLPEDFHVLNSRKFKINPLSSGEDRWLFLSPALLYRLAAR